MNLDDFDADRREYLRKGGGIAALGAAFVLGDWADILDGKEKVRRLDQSSTEQVGVGILEPAYEISLNEVYADGVDLSVSKGADQQNFDRIGPGLYDLDLQDSDDVLALYKIYRAIDGDSDGYIVYSFREPDPEEFW